MPLCGLSGGDAFAGMNAEGPGNHSCADDDDDDWVDGAARRLLYRGLAIDVFTRVRYRASRRVDNP